MNANEDGRPSDTVSCPVEALLILRKFLRKHVSLGEDCDDAAFPTSTKIGIWAYFAHLLWENLSRTAQDSVPAEDLSDQKEMLESLLDIYHNTCALESEAVLLQREEDAYRAYIKQRRRSGPRGTGGKRRTKRRRVSARGRRAVRTSLREGEDDVAEDSDGSDGAAIESESSASEAESEGAQSPVETSGRPLWRGFQLTNASNSMASGSVDRVCGRPRALPDEPAATKGPQLQITQFAAADGSQIRKVPLLLEKALLGLPGHLRSAFSRWDVQIIAEDAEENPRLTVSSLRTEARMLLFGLRSEVLDAITQSLCISAQDETGTTQDQTGDVSWHNFTGKSFYVSLFFSVLISAKQQGVEGVGRLLCIGSGAFSSEWRHGAHIQGNVLH
jgi:hypothetical protein